MESVNLLSKPLQNRQRLDFNKSNNFSGNKFLNSNNIQDTFTRRTANTPAFGKAETPAKPTSPNNPPVIEVEPVNKDLKKIETGSHYNKHLNTLDFGIHSSADRLELCIFKKDHGESEAARIPMHNAGGTKWVHSLSKDRIKELSGVDINDPNQKNKPIYYAFRAFKSSTIKHDPAWNPTDTKIYGENRVFKTDIDNKANRHNPYKVLIDSYGLEVSHDENDYTNDGSIYITGDGTRHIDTGPNAPKSIWTMELDEMSNQPVKTDNVPARQMSDHVIYEAQIFGLTKELNKQKLEELYSSELETGDEKITKLVNSWDDKYAGTYKGAIFIAPYLKKLGVMMAEVMPIMHFQDADQGGWGYMTDSFMAPARKLSSDRSPGGPTREFRNMVKAFNTEGIDICMDVVYNHNGEGAVCQKSEKEKYPEKTKLTGIKGLNNHNFILSEKDTRHYFNSSGTGNTTNAMHPDFQDLTLKTLRYYKKMGVKAFRFDLATLLGNDNHHGQNFNPGHPDGLIQKIIHDPELNITRVDNVNENGVMLIAEPWSPADWQTGHFPRENWGEWNDNYRDTMRKAVNKLGNNDRPSPADIIKCIAGSSDLMGGPAPRSNNFFAVHDGYTLYDVFAYNPKKDNDNSWNQHGNPAEHPFKAREKAVQTALGLLMVSAGSPVLLYGDERFKTKNGNNDSYNDGNANTINWSSVVQNTDDAGNLQVLNAANLAEFTGRIINFRHNHNALHPNRYFNGKDNNHFNGKDVTWYNLKGNDMVGNSDFMDRNDGEYRDVIAFRLDETEFESKPKNKVKHPSIYVAYNRGIKEHEVTLPKHLIKGKNWHLVVNTAIPVTSTEDARKKFDELAKKPAYKPGEEVQVENSDIYAGKQGDGRDKIKVEGRSLVILVEDNKNLNLHATENPFKTA